MFEEPKDIFDGIDKAAAVPQPAVSTTSEPSAAPLPPNSPSPIEPPPTHLPQGYGYGAEASSLPPMPQERHGGVGKVLILVAVVLVVFGVSGYFAYRIMVQPSSNSDVVDSVSDTGVTDEATDVTTQENETPSSTTTTTTPETQTTNPASLLDSDGDGLTNARELELGTSINKADTDGDGLGDREEVEVYGTNPRKADTDGDGYLDGQEVSGGYNPNGEGRLFGTVPSGS